MVTKVGSARSTFVTARNSRAARTPCPAVSNTSPYLKCTRSSARETVSRRDRSLNKSSKMLNASCSALAAPAALFAFRSTPA